MLECKRVAGNSKLLPNGENFLNVIEKSKNACINAGESVADHFADIRKMVDLGSGAEERN